MKSKRNDQICRFSEYEVDFSILIQFREQTICNDLEGNFQSLQTIVKFKIECNV